jgi:ParB family chromosome partitioning protein
MGHARCLISVENTEVQQQLYLKTISEEWSVRRLEDAVRQSATPAVDIPTGRVSQVNANEITEWQRSLTNFFHAPVSLKMNEAGKGEMKITFKSKEELLKVLEAIRS